MCRLLGVSKQAYYKHVDKLMFKLARESFVIEFIKEVRQKAPGIGGNHGLQPRPSALSESGQRVDTQSSLPIDS